MLLTPKDKILFFNINHNPNLIDYISQNIKNF